MYRRVDQTFVQKSEQSGGQDSLLLPLPVQVNMFRHEADLLEERGHFFRKEFLHVKRIVGLSLY